jgi:two-component system, NtrC family, sensor kinase
MKSQLYKVCLLIIILSYASSAYTQTQWVDSIKRVLQTAKEDTNKVKTLLTLASVYLASHADTGVIYSQQALDLAEKLNFKGGILFAEGFLSISLNIAGNYPLGLDYAFKTLSLAKKIDPTLRGWAYSTVSYSYYYLGEYNTCLGYTREAMKIAQPYELPYGWRDLALVFHKLNKPDSGMLYAKKAYEIFKATGEKATGEGNIFSILGDIFADNHNYDSALFFYRNGVPVAVKYYIEPELIDNYNGIAGVYKAMNNLDSAAWYCKKVLTERIERSYPLGLLKATSLLSEIYSIQKKPDSALKYMRMAITIKDSLFSREKTMAVQNLAFKELEKQKEVEATKLQAQNRLKMYSLLGSLFIVLVIAGLLFRNNKQKQKANTKIEKAYAELKATQSQLIQSEKMASLGELTAGIAHEIQNPLNFINNFSDVNKELLIEMKDEVDKGNIYEVKSIVNNLISNEEKINHHGKRADAIVKGMLQHSRSSTSVKEPTDINALADEYLRLSFHGLRARYKSFNAAMHNDYDQTIGNINIITQDIGRVLLNLYNNAFYAVSEKEKQQPESYDPTVSVTTLKTGNMVEIRVRDNGDGIPQKVKDKIFQPFFTTKPTGQGTGLGLSLSYDIIKAHGGEIKVETKEGEFTEFVVQIPTV